MKQHSSFHPIRFPDLLNLWDSYSCFSERRRSQFAGGNFCPYSLSSQRGKRWKGYFLAFTLVAHSDFDLCAMFWTAPPRVNYWASISTSSTRSFGICGDGVSLYVSCPFARLMCHSPRVSDPEPYLATGFCDTWRKDQTHSDFTSFIEFGWVLLISFAKLDNGKFPPADAIGVGAELGFATVMAFIRIYFKRPTAKDSTALIALSFFVNTSLGGLAKLPFG